MGGVIQWLEAHDKLAGWAQFFGAMLALIVTYLTVFMPIWRRKRQLRDTANRLLSHGFEVIESFHRTSAYFLPLPINLQAASLTMSIVIDEIGRFPTSELDDQGSNSLPRRLVAMSGIIGGVKLFLDETATNLNGQSTTEDDRDFIRNWVGEQLVFAQNLVMGVEMKRPEWSS